jgi:hypothetical protein
LTNNEPFPCVVFCGEQAEGHFNEWGMTTVAFDLIEHVCFSSQVVPTSDQ